MPRVLVVCEYPTLNGGERSLLAVSEHVRRGGWSWTVAAPERGPLAEALQEFGLPHIPLALHDERGVRLPPPDCRRRLAEVVRCARPGLIHANSLSMSRLAGPVADASGIPSIGHLRDLVRVSEAAIADLNRNRLLATVSLAVRDWYVRLGLDPARTRVVYNGVDVERFCPGPANGHLHRELGLPEGSVLIGAIGQLGIRKGWDVLWDALPEILAGEPRAHLLAVGARYSGKGEALDYEQRLRRRAAAAPLAGRVHFLGVREDVPSLLRELTLLVHAARQEPLGRVLLEAAATGVAIVATAVGGTAEIFPSRDADGERAAILVPPQDPASLAAAMLQLLGDDQARGKLGRAARRRVEVEFHAGHSAARLLRLYEEIAAWPA